MDQNIPETDNLLPGSRGRSASQIWRKTCSCFPDYLEVVNHPDLHQFILQKRFPAPDRIPLNLADRLKDIQEPLVLTPS
jgi:hypothetical protein